MGVTYGVVTAAEAVGARRKRAEMVDYRRRLSELAGDDHGDGDRRRPSRTTPHAIFSRSDVDFGMEEGRRRRWTAEMAGGGALVAGIFEVHRGGFRSPFRSGPGSFERSQRDLSNGCPQTAGRNSRRRGRRPECGGSTVQDSFLLTFPATSRPCTVSTVVVLGSVTNPAARWSSRLRRFVDRWPGGGENKFSSGGGGRQSYLSPFPPQLSLFFLIIHYVNNGERLHIMANKVGG